MERTSAQGTEARAVVRVRAVAWAALVAALVAFVVGILTRTSDAPSLLYDVVAYEGVYLAGAVLCWCSRAATRAERHAWRWVSLSLVLNVVGDPTGRSRWPPCRTRPTPPCPTSSTWPATRPWASACWS